MGMTSRDRGNPRVPFNSATECSELMDTPGRPREILRYAESFPQRSPAMHIRRFAAALCLALFAGLSANGDEPKPVKPDKPPPPQQVHPARDATAIAVA